jgi:putative DNA primase/helicase
MDFEMTLQHARYYLSKGMHPIPVERPRPGEPKSGKKPLVKWEKYQTTPPTEAELRSWFGKGERNIGVVLGRGVIAVDLDGDGAEELLARAGVRLPEDAPRSRTSAGYHVLLRAPAEFGDRVNILGQTQRDAGGALVKPLVDIRGRGYIVAPPSLHASGRTYEWVQRPDEIPPAPAELLELLSRRPAAAAPAAGEAVAGQLKWVTKAMAGVGEGQRDATCAKLAGYFLKKKLPEDLVRSMLYGFADRCTPPFGRADVDKTVASVRRLEDRRASVASEGAGEAEAGAVHAEPFQVLGYNQGSYFYLPRGSRQVVELRAKHHTKLDLLTLAPHAYWERAFPGPSGPRWDLAANALIRRCERAGVYDTARVRGRGAWWDTDRAVLHLGDVLVDGGVPTPIMDLQPGAYIYEAAAPMPVRLGAPMPAREAHRLVEILELANWERPISAKLLAGWITVAPICGALNWRPHVWVTGPAGSGKSWILDRIVRHMTAHIALAVQSETTEAGLRQVLGNDARPITFDEIEGDDERAQQRIQNVLALARQASSETGATIIKGSPLGVAKSYRIRSCFIFSSIGVGLQRHADETRVSVLSLEWRNPKDPAVARRFAQLEQLVAEVLTDDYVNAFNARAIRLVPTIRANARIFAAAGAAVIGSQRLGDQIGVLLAGAYALHSDGLIDMAAARAWVGEQDWSEQQTVQETSDELACLHRILEHTVRVATVKGPADRSVGELIEVAAEKRVDHLTAADAHDHLLRLGIRVDRNGAHDREDVFVVAGTHTGIERILAETPWSRGWGRILRRVPGAAATEGAVRFAGVQSRGTEIPLSLVVAGTTGQATLL